MRLFQNSGLTPAYQSRLNKLAMAESTFSGRLESFLKDRYGAPHLLKPVLEREQTAFFTNGDDYVLQHCWASEHGLPARASLEEIFLAQVEHHRADVFYNLDPMRYGTDFIKKLPQCVKTKIAWRAAPSPRADFSAYDAVVCNFPGIIRAYQARGWRAEYFSPAYDPAMDPYAANTDRPIDVLFVGGYSRHHLRRARVLNLVASLRDRFNVVFCLDRSRLTRLADSRVLHLLPFNDHSRPPATSAVTEPPVFGRDLYAKIASSKVVLNGAIDMAGTDRGNMRCFEAAGCGALMVSDRGTYPPGFVDGRTMILYEAEEEAVGAIEDALVNPERAQRIAAESHQMVRTQYSKMKQWDDFNDLVARLGLR
jgi:hypothetical protein